MEKLEIQKTQFDAWKAEGRTIFVAQFIEAGKDDVQQIHITSSPLEAGLTEKDFYEFSTKGLPPDKLFHVTESKQKTTITVRSKDSTIDVELPLVICRLDRKDDAATTA